MSKTHIALIEHLQIDEQKELQAHEEKEQREQEEMIQKVLDWHGYTGRHRVTAEIQMRSLLSNNKGRCA